MTRVVDIRHLLGPCGNLPWDDLRARRLALRIAQLIQAGGPLARGQFRDTLVACTARPNGKPCLGLLCVDKQRDDRIWAHCPRCMRDQILISGWQETMWADGPMDPMTEEQLALPHDVN